MHKLKIIAHRCRGFRAPENSLLAMKRALASALDEIEIDIQLTADNQPIMIHNPWFRNKFGITYVSDWTLKEIKRLKKGTYGFATLDEVLKCFKEHNTGQILNLDVKNRGVEKEILKAIKKYDLERQVTIVCWIPQMLKDFHKLNPKIRLSYSFIPIPRMLFWLRREIHWLLHPNKNIIYVNDTERYNPGRHPAAAHNHFLCHVPKNLPFDSINIFPSWNIFPYIVREAHALKKEVRVVNSDRRLDVWRLSKVNIDGIMTNKPKKFLKEQKGTGRRKDTEKKTRKKSNRA